MKGFSTVGDKVDSFQHEFSRDISKIKIDQKETQEIAAVALTKSDQVGKKLESLEARVLAIEQGKVTTTATALPDVGTGEAVSTLLGALWEMKWLLGVFRIIPL